MTSFRKRPAEPDSARAEAAGLRWLREASSAVVEVVLVDDHMIETALVRQVPPTADLARTAGFELARIHAAGAEAFGAPPPGWDGPNYIGTQFQFCRPTDNWAEFYVHQRVLPFAEAAVRRGNLSLGGYDLVDAACAAICSHDWVGEPARIHGDLWSGNLLFGDTGPAFIDPAAHGGHPETDLAMLHLFGAPFLDDIVAGYQQHTPLREGWRRRIPMHQLHPLAVHAVTHGPGYGSELIRCAKDTLAAIG
ncbi:fructosamine kinase family protein [Corynebacterium ulceribovis]|uniref:fructosamine kinase family protein n=1 Tax=Corynebacterium ulceribovis TaxID=487732 RepID=UPI00035DB488|nr:fructosamine kinase family protein [Corynebacterium ulceribovis]